MSALSVKYDGIARLGDHQLWLHDARAERGALDFSDEAITRGAAPSSTGHALVIHTYRAAGWVTLQINTLTEPEVMPAERLGQVVTELSLHVPSGALVVNGIDATSHTDGFGSVAVPAGWLRVRITQHDQDAVVYDGDIGADSYTVSVWPAEPGPAVSLASCEPNDAFGDAWRERVAPEHAASTRSGALVRQLIHHEEGALPTLQALAASDSVHDRLIAANACAFATSQEARAIHARLCADPDARVSEQAQLYALS